MKRIIYILFAISILTIIPQLTQAEESKNYIGFGIGQSTGEITAPTAYKTEESGTAFKIFGGTEISRRLALEVGYANFGEFKSYFVSGNEVDTYETSALFATVIGKSYITDEVNVFLRLGLHYWMLDFEADMDVPPYSSSSSGNGFNYLYGFGISYDKTEKITVRLDVERYGQVADGMEVKIPPSVFYDLNAMDVTVVGLVCTYSF